MRITDIKHYQSSYSDILVSKSTVVLALGLLGAIASIAASVVFLPLGLSMISLSCTAIIFGLASFVPKFDAKKQDAELFENGISIVNDVAKEAPDHKKSMRS